MTTATDPLGTPATGVTVYWRPGCPYCMRLRAGLRRAGVRAAEVDIWKDPVAAATVRDITGGDETVPTVVIGSQAMVNPSPRRVVAALREAGGAPVGRPDRRRTGGWRALLPPWRPETGAGADAD